jgi:hypothetical protein
LQAKFLATGKGRNASRWPARISDDEIFFRTAFWACKSGAAGRQTNRHVEKKNELRPLICPDRVWTVREMLENAAT